MDRGYVYLVECRERYKIGVSQNPKERKEALEEGGPFELKLLTTIPTDNPYKLERKYHRRFKAQRVKGEWFELTEDQIEQIKKRSVLDKTKPETSEEQIEQAMERLKMVQKARGLTREEIANEIGISDTSFDNWLKGRSKPNLKSWFKIQNYLGGD